MLLQSNDFVPESPRSLNVALFGMQGSPQELNNYRIFLITGKLLLVWTWLQHLSMKKILICNLVQENMFYHSVTGEFLESL